MKYYISFFMLLSMYSFAAPKMNPQIDRKTSVESDHAHYNGKEITLTGHVVIKNDMGEVIAENAHLIRDEERKYKIDFPWIELSKQVTFNLANGKTFQCHHLTLDYPELTSHFIGDPQIHYRDEIGEVFADRAQIDYFELDGNIEPVKITLIGNVQMINSSSEKKRETRQYALADYVVYYPDQELMVLEGLDGKQVLFYDQIKDVTLSAKTVRAQRNPETGKESVQGLGDVRFLFAPDELANLKKTFHWES